jgi:lysophospholipase L1-like esterase
MTFKRTTPITTLDLDPSDLPDAGPSSKGGVTLNQLAKWRRRDMPRPDQVDVVMSSPPTIGTHATSTSITNSTLVKAVSGTTPAAILNNRWKLLGATGWVISGTSYPEYNYIKNTSHTAPSSSGSSFTVEFMYYGTAFEVFMKGNGASVRMRVNGQLATTGTTWTMLNDGGVYYVPVTFGSAGLRRITLECSSNVRFGGIVIGPADSITASETRGPRVAVMGDSFTEGTGASASQAWWGRKMAETLGWYDLAQSGVGATGYLNPATGGKVKFRDRVVNDVINLNPDVVIIAGGINDQGAYSAAAIEAEASLLFAQIKAALPNVTLIALSPFWNKGAESTVLAIWDLKDAIKAAALANGAFFVDLLEMPMDSSVAAPVSTTLAAGASVSATTISSNALIPNRATIEIGTGSTASDESSRIPAAAARTRSLSRA